jgi:hypothetical protein
MIILQKNSLKLDEKSESSNFEILPLLTPFGWFYPRNNKRYSKFVDKPQGLNSINLKKKKPIKIGWKIKILYAFQIYEISEFWS